MRQSLKCNVKKNSATNRQHFVFCKDAIGYWNHALNYLEGVKNVFNLPAEFCH